MNLFRYCDDDPVDRSDPSGLWADHTYTGGFNWWDIGASPAFSAASNNNSKPAGIIMAAISLDDEESKGGGASNGGGEGAKSANGPTKLTRKLEPSFSVDTYDKAKGTIWIHRRWVYTLSNASGPLAGVRVDETIHMTNKVGYKDFPRHTDGYVTDRYGRVYDNWKVGFSTKSGSVTITQGLFTAGSTTKAEHTVTIGASHGGGTSLSTPRTKKTR